MQRVEELVAAIETWTDPNLRAKAVELVQALMDFHGAGIDRMMEITAERGAVGYEIFDEYAKGRFGRQYVAALRSASA